MCETDIYGLCRVCLNDSHSYSHIYEELIRDDYLYEVLNDVCQLDVKVDDGLPEFVCCECYNRIFEFESFKRQSHEGSATLQCMRGDLDIIQVKVEDDSYEVESLGGESIEEDDGVGFPAEVTIKVEEDSFDDESVEDDDARFSAEVSIKAEEDETFENESMEEQLEYPAQVRVKVEKVNYEEEYSGEDDGLELAGDDEASFGDSSRQAYSGYHSETNEGVDGGPISTSSSITQGQYTTNTQDAKLRRCLTGQSRRGRTPSDGRNNSGSSCSLTGSGLTVDGGSLKVEQRKREKVYVCELCYRTFCSRSNLNVHRRKHSGVRPYSCSTCGKTFADSSHFKRHQRIHTRVRTYVCKTCNASFTERSDLAVHKKLHAGERPITCSVCNKSFSSKSNLTVHNRIHSGERPYVCELCGKSFADSSHFMRHKKAHSGQKPYVCELCNKCFSTKFNLQEHQRAHLGLKRYSCDVCGKGFSTKFNLRGHMRVHGEGEEVGVTMMEDDN